MRLGPNPKRMRMPCGVQTTYRSEDGVRGVANVFDDGTFHVSGSHPDLTSIAHSARFDPFMDEPTLHAEWIYPGIETAGEYTGDIEGYLDLSHPAAHDARQCDRFEIWDGEYRISYDGERDMMRFETEELSPIIIRRYHRAAGRAAQHAVSTRYD